jgi:2-methylisocitrate lyase-like PEP mutase family enzyme
MTSAFHALHQGPEVLILANAWDAGSARLIETLGAKAIATSSAAVAWSHGYGDGHHLPIDALVATVREIVRAISIPLTVDIEGGYADDAKGVGENVARVIDAGGVGINIEDGKLTPEQHCAKIAAARAAAEKAGAPLFINARTDVYLKGIAEGEAALTETLRRAALYRNAGADGLFVPGPTDTALFAEIARAVQLPLNVMSRAGVAPLNELQAAGVRRLSAATGIARAALEATRAAASAFLASGDSSGLAAAGGAPSDYNALFKGKK